ncbi:SMC family ATPase [Arthrobacter gandavensis]|uniref:AAA family ATPase n=1 Tax=Arthrobacter gandavensis TaxID=169960 RepID=UPI00188EB017|nr:SMC family ATPase [Arthrobacter gandavensis]MBF4993534.1 SMC family ATPase [Arthrobacter gandavensis]
MRIHRLEMQAFGPFAGRQEIDFDELGAQGLFLLNGPTGAGKTSVLDAVCFALYGSVPGARQEARKLRSDHAAPGVAPEVLLDFSAGNRRFKVIRRPQWERPAKRAGSATGTVTEQARTLLSELVQGEWVQKTARNDEAATEIQDLLGMSREQFTRVVMLPQGDFAAFLRADATSRAELLQRLFGTWRYEEIEQQLKSEAEAARTELSLAQADAELLRARAQSEAERCARLLGSRAAGSAAPAVPPAAEQEPAEAGSAWISAVRAAVSDQLSSLREAQAGKITGSKEAEDFLHRLEARRARGLARLQLEAEEREHAARQAAGLPKRALLDSHLRAEGLKGYLDALTSAEHGFRRAEAAGHSALAALGAAAAPAGLGDLIPEGTAAQPAPGSQLPNADALSDLEERTGKELSAAENALADAERAAELAALKKREAAREAQLRGEAAGAEDAAAALREEQASLRAALPALRTGAAETDAARRRIQEAAGTLEVIRNYKTSHAAALESAERAAQARDRFQDARGRWQDLLQLRLDQAAAELAASLEPGGDCPVCGSTSHPAPAPLPEGGQIVSREEEAEARAASGAAEKEWEAARALAEADASAAAALRAQGGDSDPDEARRAGVKAEEDLRAAKKAAAGLGEAEDRLRAIEAELGQLEQARSSHLQAAAQAQARAAAAEEESVELSRRGPGDLSDRGAFAARLEQLESVRRLTVAARSALQAARQAGGFQAEAARTLQDALSGTPFPDAGAVRAALLPAAEAEELRAEFAALDAQAARLAMRREDEEALAQLDSAGVPEPMPNEEDVAEAAEAADAARQAVSDGAVQIGLLEGSAGTLEDLAGRLAGAEAEMEPLQVRCSLLTSLSDTARGNGENNYRMALSTYVLAARLEQVAAAATERLAAMTGGRYSLVHDDSRSGNRKAGLGLHVIDDWTGVRRDTSTLSGGESFMASLALALGLADVVQQESGGTSMETLFVDEGFGSLDEEALEQVMDALEGLRDGGRVVGLVSHVSEMKQRISAQLQISRGRNGSTVSYRTVDALPV